MANFHPSNEQKDMFSSMIEGNNKRFSFIAPAGCGKTSTVLYFMDILSTENKLLYLVFNVINRKDIEQRLSYSNSPYNNLNKENVDIFTLNGYMRKVLSERVKDVIFDYSNGDFSPSHLETVLKDIGLSYSANNSSASVTESFNNYSEEFLKGIIPLSEYMAKDKLPYINDSVLSELKETAKVLHGVDIDTMSFEEQQKEVKSIYNHFMKSIFNENVLSQHMPHSIYYRYVYENYKDENLFQGYNYIFIDEAQDIDLVITSLLENSGVKVVKFGDDFQQINAFRGTVNSLQDDRATVKYLSMSYRLTPYLALLSSAYLKNQGTKLGIDSKKIPQIYGRGKTNNPLGEQKVSEYGIEEYTDNVINFISNIKIEENETYIELMEKKENVVSSIIKGCKGKFNDLIKDFSKTKNYERLVVSIQEYTTFLSTDLLSEPKDYLALLSKEDEDNDKLGDVHNEIFQIYKAYTMKFSKKEKLELLQNESYAYLSKNNAKVMDSAYRFIKEIPFEPLSDIPLFNIKINSTLVAKFDDITRGNFSSLRQREQAIFFQGMDNLIIKDVNMSVQDALKIAENSPLSPKILNALIQSSSIIDKYVSTKPNNGTGNSLEDYGISADSVKNAIKKAIQQTKRKTGLDEVTAEDIISCGFLTNLRGFANYGSIITEKFTLEDVQNIFNPFVENYFKYCKIKEANVYNPNISLVSERGASNVCFSTGHQAKGLEFSHVFIGNDIYYIPEDMECSKEDEIAEFNLAYVCMTRAKESLTLESGSSLYPQLQESIKSGFSRSYISKGTIVEEKLSDIPQFVARWQDSESKAIVTKDIMFLDDSIYPNYKDISVISNMAGNVQDLAVLNDYDFSQDGIMRSYLKPESNDDISQIENSWNLNIEQQKIYQEEIMLEAESVF